MQIAVYLIPLRRQPGNDYEQGTLVMCPKVTSQYKTEIREKIVGAAIIAFSVHGYDRTRMDDIAETAKLSKGTLYLYFKNKEELFYAISENNIRELKEQLSVLFTKSEDLISDSQKFYVNFRKASGPSDKVFLETIAESSRNRKLQDMLHRQRMKVLDVITDYLRLQIRKGFFRSDVDVNAIAAGLVALYDGLTIGKTIGISETYNKKAWNETIKAVLSSLR
ncbi:MAG: TetR/AcrR family transcriptional regulator [Thermoproteota archaeon]|nr:TetR/AcrR family transcriptional regulator [Thermoproteota archaeon]HYZ94779.1 TetR/AcrR family transcriptional regulator [Nitrososphaeraceae archaeon]